MYGYSARPAFNSPKLDPTPPSRKVAKKYAAAKKRARERKVTNSLLPKLPARECSSSSEAGTEPADTQAEHDGVSNVISVLGSLQVNTGELTPDVLQSSVFHSARLPKEEPAGAGAVDGPCFEIKLPQRRGWESSPFAASPNEPESSQRSRSLRCRSAQPKHQRSRAFERLSAEDKMRFLQLADAHYPGSSPIRSIFLANRINLGGSAAVFLTTSRPNHSCLPNIDYALNILNDETSVHAFKDIKKEEDILTSYAHPYRTALQRKEQELKYYNFDCGCMARTPPSAFCGKGEKRRSKMYEFDKEIAMWGMEDVARSCNRNFYPMTVIEGLVELLEEEGLTHGELSQTYADVAKWSKKLGRYRQASAAGKWRGNDRICVGLNLRLAEDSGDLLAELEAGNR